MLSSGHQEVDDDLVALVIQEYHQEVCKTPMSIKIENDNDEYGFWDDLEKFIMELNTPHRSTKWIN